MESISSYITENINYTLVDISNLNSKVSDLENLDDCESLILKCENNNYCIKEADNVLKYVCSIKNLKKLSLIGSCFNYLPKQLSELGDLENIRIDGTSINFIPYWFSELCNLKKVSIDHNKKLEYLPFSISKLKKLEYLILDNNNLKEIPDLSSLINLKNLDLSCNKLSEINPNHIPLANLESLSIERNNIHSLDSKLLKDFLKKSDLRGNCFPKFNNFYSLNPTNYYFFGNFYKANEINNNDIFQNTDFLNLLKIIKDKNGEINNLRNEIFSVAKNEFSIIL
ncbi:MAG: hypothetical protein PHN56_07480 [Candidatus Nanoarchaeia archaeon]|nr:hypothetical protein [Candidatus Nanoarchaeia archaeon]